MHDKNNKNIYEVLSKFDFECQKCSRCCRIEPGAVYLTENDVKNIAGFFSISIKEFINTFCRGIYKNGKIQASLVEKENFDCIFWEQDRGCVIYNVRPVQCRTYPFWPEIVESKRERRIEAERCKGINKKGNISTDEKLDLYIEEKNAKPYLLD